MSDVQRPLRDALLRVLKRPYAEPHLTAEQGEARLNAAKPIAFSENVFAALSAMLRRHGYGGDLRTAALLYTVVSSRLLATPMTALVKLPPDPGRASPVDRVLELLPTDQVEIRSGFSAKAIAYGFKSLRHKVLVLREAGGLTAREGEMLWRGLTPDGLTWEVARCRGSSCYTDEVRREGPLALVMVTVKESVRPAGAAARALPIALDDDDSDADIAAIGRRFAGGPRAANEAAELDTWRAFQEILQENPCEVVVPFAPALSRLYAAQKGPVRRLFQQVLAAVATSALLHRFTRGHDATGAVIATLADYAHARWMLETPLAAAAAGAADLPDGVQELLDVLREDGARGPELRGLDLAELAAKMNVDRTTAWRRARKAEMLGLAADLAGGHGRRSRWVAIERSAECQLPEPDVVAAAIQADEIIEAVAPADGADAAERPAEADDRDGEPIEAEDEHGPEPDEDETETAEPTADTAEPAPPLAEPEPQAPPSASAAPLPAPIGADAARTAAPPVASPPPPEPPRLPPIIARAPNPKSLTGGYVRREDQFRFRAAMERMIGRRWNGAPGG